jgi:hypothetical protein
MRKENVEDRLIKLAAIIGTDYKPYIKWVKADLKGAIKNLKIRYKAELLAHIHLRQHKKEYGRAEELFYGQVREIGKI